MSERIIERENGSRRVQFVPEGESMAKQEFRDECDLNYMMQKYQATGMLTVNRSKASYSDLTNATSYHDAMNKVNEADMAFKALPAKLRADFDNDPALFLEAIEKDGYEKVLEDAGLIFKAAEPDSDVTSDPDPEPTGDGEVTNE